ncbi:MAG TPA: carbohydrate-binding protein [Herpetosiphonaceae bacterium]
MGALLLLALALQALAAPQPSRAAGETVGVWVTTEDQSKLLQQQAPASFGPDGPANATTIDVNPAVTYQQMDGFGASLTDSSAWLINQLSVSSREQLLQALFNPSTGIGLSFLRQPMGGSDFSLGSYSYDDTCCDLNDFTLSNGHDNAYIIPQLQRIKQINPQVRLMATPWSPPTWMKTSGGWYGGGDGNPSRLLGQHYATYAAYFVKYVQQYAAQGLPIDFVTLQNEPYNNNNGMPAMHMDPGEQAAFIKNNLGPAFAQNGIGAKILVWDHNWDVPDYPTSVLNDAAARQYVAGVAWHCYGGGPEAQTAVRNAYPDKGAWLTECSSGTWVGGGSWQQNGSFGANLYRNVRQLVIGSTRNWSRSVINWNLVLDQSNGPTNGPGACFTCFAAARVNTASKTWSPDVDYYSLGHVSKFVAPGAYRIASNTFGGGIENVAFKNPDGSIALVALNAGGSSSTFKVRWAGQSFSYTLPRGAVATFRWNAGPTPPAAIPGRIEAESFAAQSGTELEATTDAGGGQNAGYIDAGDWLDYPVNVAAAGSYAVQYRVASTGTSGQIQLRSGATTLATTAVPNTGGWQTWTTVQATVNLAAGQQTLRVHAGGGGFNLNWLHFTAASVAYPIPGQIEAEGYAAMSGIQLEATTDAGGGQNVGYIDAGDWLDYPVNVAAAGSYTVQYRVASTGTSGQIQLRSGATTLATTAVPNTGDWQAWTTVQATVNLAAGQQTLRVHAGGGGFNLNWLRFASAATCGSANAAQGRPASASSIENASLAAANAVDGSGATRWASAWADPQWLQVDLGAARSICRVVVSWEAAYATAFQIQVSDDGASWSSIYSTTTGGGGTQTLNVSGAGRYLRVYATGRGTPYGYSLWELQVNTAP